MEARENSVAPSTFHYHSHPSMSASVPSPSSNNNNVAIDIGHFVERHKELLELLFPFRLIGSAVIHVVRWENYQLSFAILLCLCVLFYYPAFLVGFLVAIAIAGMALGKYYSQTSGTKRKRERDPPVNYLNEDSQELNKLHKENKASHKVLLEYKQIINNADMYMSMACYTLEYLNRVVLWKSLEVSICVTVLLCVLLALICTVYLRVLFALLPLLVLCFNKYFLSRTVEIWRQVFRSVKIRLKRRDKDQETKKEVEVPANRQPTAAVPEVVHHYDQSEGAGSSTEVQASGNAVPSGEPDEERGGAGGVVATGSRGGGATGTGPSKTRSATLPSSVAGASVETNASSKDGQLKEPSIYGKGVCYKCNASFAKLLKRKHDCNSCGESFCGSCTVKVKRAELGATSPAAFEESVRVCLDCKKILG